MDSLELNGRQSKHDAIQRRATRIIKMQPDILQSPRGKSISISIKISIITNTVICSVYRIREPMAAEVSQSHFLVRQTAVK